MRTSKNPFIIFSLIFYLLISLIAIAAYTISARQLNHSFIGQQLSLASETIQLRLASIVNSELALVRKLADTPVIRQYFLNPHDPELEASSRIEFYEYQEHFNLKVVFWVNDVDKIFYSSGNQPYIIDPDDPESYWYNLTLFNTERYNFNINYNRHMEQINLWINVPVFHKDENGMRHPLGMLGTGIDLTEFSDFIINAYKDFNENITPYTFNKFNEITSAANYDLVFNKVR
ncbi:MAG: methyl-accepting chemotaxis protein, partial [Treponema sp.]|nr:methyl-accepting chemotaxis protein [Treponema sp.]